MRLGALISPHDGAEAKHIARQAQSLEQAGYSSLWSAHAMGRGFMMSDPFVALSVAAAVTEKVELGTGVLQLPLYHPTDVALKSYALTQVSGNRFILGVGAGSTPNDYAIHNVPFDERFLKFAADRVQLQQIFQSGKAGLPLMPWASVQGGPPMFYGTWGKNVELAANEFDGWIASGMHRTPQECAAAMARYRSAAGDNGRAIVSTIQLSAETDLGELKARLQLFAEAGFDDAVVMFLPGAPSYDAVRLII